MKVMVKIDMKIKVPTLLSKIIGKPIKRTEHMENKENIQMPEINEVEVASANEVKAEENSQEPANKVEKEKKHRRICLGGARWSR